MASSPKYKVFNPSGEYVASCKYAEDAAAVVALYGDGAQIRTSHSKRDTVWIEGEECESAANSVDFVAQRVSEREYNQTI